VLFLGGLIALLAPKNVTPPAGGVAAH